MCELAANGKVREWERGGSATCVCSANEHGPPQLFLHCCVYGTIGVNLQHTLKQCNADDFKAYLPNSVKDSMYCAPVTKDEILKIITKLKNNKSPGPECLTPKITKICCWCDN